LTIFHRVLSALTAAQIQGWENVTNFKLKKINFNTIFATCTLFQTRGSWSPSFIFKSLFDSEIVQELLKKMNSSLLSKKPNSEKHGGLFLEKDLYDAMATILDSIVHPEKTQTTYIRKAERKGVSKNQWEKFVQHLQFNEKKVFSLLCQKFQSAVLPGGEAALDETIWPWKGNHVGTTHIDRKTHPDGFKVLKLCIQLSTSNRPYCLHFIPDIAADKIGAFNALNQFKPIIKKYNLSVIGDSWFGMVNWMKAHHEVPMTCALSENQLQELWPIFTYNLKYQQYRFFKKGPLIVQVYSDASTFKVASTCFTLISTTERLPTTENHFTTNIAPPELLLSQETAEILSNVKVDDLKKLASALGLSSSNIYSNITYI